MNIHFYSYAKRINSTKVGIVAEIDPPLPILNLTGDFEEESSIFSPSIIVAHDAISTLQQYNYFSIDFPSGQIPARRYYFIRDISIMPSGRCRVEGIEDIFATFPDIKASKIHLTATNRFNMNTLVDHKKPVSLPTDYRKIVEKRIDLSNKFLLDPVDGCYVIGIAMVEASYTPPHTEQTPFTNEPSRPRASLIKSGIGYYVFSYAGAAAFMSFVTEVQAKNSDFKINDKIVSIMYLPIAFRNVPPTGVDPTTEMGFLAGWSTNSQGVYAPYYISIPRVSSAGFIAYSTYTDWQDSIADYGWNATDAASSFIPQSEVKYDDVVSGGIIDQLNYEPYTNLEVNLPIFGTLEVNISDLYNPYFDSTIYAGSYSCFNKLDAKVDIVTGVSTIRLIKVCTCTPSGGGTADVKEFVIFEKTAQLGVNIPYYGYDSAGMIERQLLETEHNRELKAGLADMAGNIIGIAAAGAGGMVSAVGALGGGRTVRKFTSANAQVNMAGLSMLGSAASYGGWQENYERYNYRKMQMNIQHGYVIGSNSGTVLGTNYSAFAIVRSVPLAVIIDSTTNDMETALPIDLYTSINELLEISSGFFTGAFIQADVIYPNIDVRYMTYDEQSHVSHLLTSGVFIE